MPEQQPNKHMEVESSLEEEISKIEAKIKEAEETGGAQEIRDALLEKADLYLKHEQIEESIKNYELAFNKSISCSKKMDIVFSIMCIQIKVRKDLEKTKECVDRCHQLLKEGGDWERKNKLKVYEGVYLLQVRELDKGAHLLLDCLATFNSPELLSYDHLVFLTVCAGMVTLTRQSIYKQILLNSEILSSLQAQPHLQAFVSTFYKCQYNQFFQAFLHIIQTLSTDFFLHNHRKYYIREMRVVIYNQFLESYKTVTLQQMASSFGVSTNFIDRELSTLIAQKKMTCKIDKVNGIIESERIDQRNGLYQQALKQGDLLITKIQKLSRQIDI